MNSVTADELFKKRTLSDDIGMRGGAVPRSFRKRTTESLPFAMHGLMSGASDKAAIPGLGLAPQELPYIQVRTDTNNWVDSGTAASKRRHLEAETSARRRPTTRQLQFD